MKTQYFFEGEPITDTRARMLMADATGGQHVQKCTLYELTERQARGEGAKEPNQRAVDLLQHLTRADVYTADDWTRDGDLHVQRGQMVPDAVVDNLSESVPPCIVPNRSGGGLFQCGEPLTSDPEGESLFHTFKYRGGGLWEYVGVCYRGTADQPTEK